MKRIGRSVLGLAVLPLLACGEGIDWCASRAEATRRALDSAQLILLVAGRPTCGNCTYMKETVCESASVRAVIDGHYVCWLCHVDESTEWYPYAAGLGSFYLPLICVIEPGDPIGYLDRTTSIQHENAFRERLLSHLPDPPPRIDAIRRASASGVELLFLGLPDCSYRVLGATDLAGPWAASAGLIPGCGLTVTNEMPAASSRGFFRLLGFR